MEVLENNCSTNKDQIIHLVNKTVNKSIAELRKLSNRSYELTTDQVDDILYEYKKLLKAGTHFDCPLIGGLEYWIPLMNVVHAKLTTLQSSKLLCVISVSLYHTLMNPISFKTINDLITNPNYFGKMDDFLRGFTNDATNVTLSLDNVDFIVDIIDVPDKLMVDVCLKFTNSVIGGFARISYPLEELQALSNKNSRNTQQEVIRSLEDIVNVLLDDEMQDICVLCLLNSGMIDFINDIKASSYTIKTYCQIIRYITIERLSVKFYENMITSCQSLKSKGSISMSFSSLNVCNKDIDVGFKFLLEALNHDNEIFSSLHKMNLIYSTRILGYIISYTQLGFGKFNIFNMFNNLHPKKSLLNIFNDINFRMVKIYLAKKNIVICDILKIQVPKSPPFPKESYLLDSYENEKPNGFEQDIDNYRSLVVLCLSKSLQLISLFSGEEADLFETSKSYLTPKIMLFKFQKLLDLLLLNGLVYYHLDKVLKQIGFNYIFAALKSYLDHTKEYRSTIWSFFINRCYKVASNDLRLIDIIRYILNGLLTQYKQDSILQDLLVKHEIVELVTAIGYDNVNHIAILDYTGIVPDNSIILINSEALASSNKQETDEYGTISTNLSSLSLDEGLGSNSLTETQQEIPDFNSTSGFHSLDQYQPEPSNGQHFSSLQTQSPLSQFTHIFESPHYSNYTANLNPKFNYSNSHSGDGF